MDDVGYDDMIFRPAELLPRKDRVYSEDGVDLTLIRWMLSLTPTERLRQLKIAVASLQSLRAKKEKWTPRES